MSHLRIFKLNYYKAKSQEIDEIFNIYSKSIIKMEKDGIHQWDNIYPDKEIIAEDIAQECMYIGKIGSIIVVCFTLSEEYDEEYKNRTWKYPESKFCIIHRLCVSPDFQNKGIAGETLNYIEILSKSQGYEAIRLDCFTENPYSKKLYDKAGYNVVGYADWRKGRFELREKKL